jgi:Na+-translocating ferredoxin:NAD+ oxidoreductase RNF subunit RnfB
MDAFINILIATGILFAVAILVALLLALAQDKLVVNDTKKEDIEKIEFYLPSYNCGACGHVNCRQVATEMVEGKIKEVSVCKVISKDNAKLIVDYCKEHNIDVK